jgi:hypothetical protein
LLSLPIFSQPNRRALSADFGFSVRVGTVLCGNSISVAIRLSKRLAWVLVGGIMIVKCVEIYITSESKPVRFVYPSEKVVAGELIIKKILL